MRLQQTTAALLRRGDPDSLAATASESTRGLSRIRRLTTPLPLLGLAPLVFNLIEHGVHVRRGEVAREPPRQYGIRPKLPGFI